MDSREGERDESVDAAFGEEARGDKMDASVRGSYWHSLEPQMYGFSQRREKQDTAELPAS